MRPTISSKFDPAGDGLPLPFAPSHRSLGVVIKRIAATFLVLALASLWAAVPGYAQKASELRTVEGTVIDKSEAPVGSAVVYLKNLRTLTVKTYISEDKGDYHFSGLDPNANYELHAEQGDRISANHTVSTLDSRKDFVVTLKLDKDKKK